MRNPIVIVLREEPARSTPAPQLETESDFWLLALACVGAWMIGRWIGQTIIDAEVPEAFREAFRE